MTTLPATLDRCPECGEPPADTRAATLDALAAVALAINALVVLAVRRRRAAARAALELELEPDQHLDERPDVAPVDVDAAAVFDLAEAGVDQVEAGVVGEPR